METTEEPTCGLDGCDERAATEGKGVGFCSQRHYHTGWRIRTGRLVPKPAKTCLYPECGKEFIPRLDSQMYCTPEHRKADYGRKGDDGITVGHARRSQETRTRNSTRSQAWFRDNPERGRELLRNRSLRAKGLTPAGFTALETEFTGTCWICRRPSTELTRGGRVRHLHIDHDHAHADGDPAGVRGLLDTWCNTRLALVEDAAAVARIGAYLIERGSYLPPAAGEGDTRRGYRWHTFGLTTQQYEAMTVACGNVCEICGQPEAQTRAGAPRALSVDHDHGKTKGEPGFIRGLLCNSCNSAVGVYENREWWTSAEAYLTWAPPLAQRLIAPFPLGR